MNGAFDDMYGNDGTSDEFDQLRLLSSGDFTHGSHLLRERAASAAIDQIVQRLDAERKAPDITAYGLGLIQDVAGKLALANEYQRIFWQRLLYRMLDPAFTEIEIRRDDIQLIETLNPSDALLVYAGGRDGLVFKRCHQQWQASETCKRLHDIGRGENGTESLFKLFDEGVPFSFLMDALALELDTQLRLDERAFNLALRQRRADSDTPHPLFANAWFCDDYCNQLAGVLMGNTKRGTVSAKIGVDITKVISQLRSYGRLALVDYGLNETAMRLHRLL